MNFEKLSNKERLNLIKKLQNLNAADDAEGSKNVKFLDTERASSKEDDAEGARNVKFLDLAAKQKPTPKYFGREKTNPDIVNLFKNKFTELKDNFKNKFTELKDNFKNKFTELKDKSQELKFKNKLKDRFTELKDNFKKLQKTHLGKKKTAPTKSITKIDST